MDTLENAEYTIFNLRKKADLELQAGNTEAFQRVQATIADIQKTTGAVKGAERKDNARTA
jgi:hypothetical protein